MTETPKPILEPPTLFQRNLYRFCRWVVIGFCRLYFRLEVRGLEHVPDGPFVLASVHRSNLDSLYVAAVTKRRLRYLGKHTMWKYDLPGRFFTAMGGIPVHRGGPDREALRACVTVIEQGEPVVIFPEGQRKTGPVVEDVFDGPAFVAGRTGVPILPIGIGGSEAAMAPGSKAIKPVKVVMIVGEPLDPPVGSDGKRPSRRQVSAATDVLRNRVQELFDEAQRAVGRL